MLYCIYSTFSDSSHIYAHFLAQCSSLTKYHLLWMQYDLLCFTVWITSREILKQSVSTALRKQQHPWKNHITYITSARVFPVLQSLGHFSKNRIIWFLMHFRPTLTRQICFVPVCNWADIFFSCMLYMILCSVELRSFGLWRHHCNESLLVQLTQFISMKFILTYYTSKFCDSIFLGIRVGPGLDHV